MRWGQFRHHPNQLISIQILAKQLSTVLPFYWKPVRHPLAQVGTLTLLDPNSMSDCLVSAAPSSRWLLVLLFLFLSLRIDMFFRFPFWQ